MTPGALEEGYSDRERRNQGIESELIGLIANRDRGKALQHLVEKPQGALEAPGDGSVEPGAHERKEEPRTLRGFEHGHLARPRAGCAPAVFRSFVNSRRASSPASSSASN